MAGELRKTEKFNYGEKVSPFRFSHVDILIPFHGQYVQVRRLVESILLYTKSNPYLIYLIDDASPNVTFFDTLLKMAPIKGKRMEKQSGFAGALKAGFDNTNNPWVVFLHSDCLIKDHYWLQKLGESCLELKEENVKLVHARTNNPMMDHPVLKETEQFQSCADKVVDEALPLICAMSHRGLFQNINGFLKLYPYAGYEDVELFYRMKKFGYKQAVCGNSWVYHSGGATIKEVSRNKKIREIMENNYELCMKDIN